MSTPYSSSSASSSASNSYVIFQDASPTRTELVEAARRFIGVKYSSRGSFVTWNEELGRYEGKTNCLKFLFHVARDVGYLAPDFDVNLSRPLPKLSLVDLMQETLQANLLQIPPDEMLPGDVMLMLYKDVNRLLTSPHHVAIYTSPLPIPGGSFIHCEDHRGDGSGGVVEIRLSSIYRTRIHSVWRLKGIRD